MGVLPGGGEGEGESTQDLVDRLKDILDVAGRAGEALGYEGVKAWADLESTKVELLGGVIMLFEGTGTGADIVNSICEAGIDKAGGPIPGFDLSGRIPSDLQFIYDTVHQGMKVDTPDVPMPSGIICDAILGGD